MTKLFAFTIPAAIITAAASSVIYAGSGKKNRTQSLTVRVRTLFAAFALFICFAFAAQNSSAATLTVTNTNDSGAGSLRQKIIDAAAGDTIVFDTAGVFATAQTINLTGLQLTIAKNLTITGPGARLLTVRKTFAGLYVNGIFTINSGSTVRISGVTVSNGNAGTYGGGFTNFGTLAIDGVAVTGDQSSESAINNNGTMTMTNSTVSGSVNVGIYNEAGTLTIANSTISGNSGTGNGVAGGIFSRAAINLNNVTVANNANGGIENSGGTFNVRNTIIADGIRSAFVSQGNNLVVSTAGGTGFTQPTDKTNVAANLAALANNGGQTNTHSLNTGSPAIDAGNNCVVTASCGTNNPPVALTTDQRGAGFARQRGASVDIGAVETGQPTAATVSVGGRVTTATGRGIRNVYLTLTDEHGNTRMAVSSSFGYYRFEDVAAGETYIISASAKRYTFSQQTQVLNLNADNDDVNFIADGF